MTVTIDPRCPWVQVHPAPNGPAWRLVGFKYENWNESGGNREIYVHLVRGDGTPASSTNVFFGWPNFEKPDEQVAQPTNPNGDTDFPMTGDSTINDRHPRGPYWVMPEKNRGASDMVDGFGLPNNYHVNYRLSYQWVTDQPPPPPPPPVTVTSRNGIHVSNVGTLLNPSDFYAVSWTNLVVLHLNKGFVPDLRAHYPNALILMRAYTNNWFGQDPVEWAQQIAGWANELKPYTVDWTFANEQNLAAEGHPNGAPYNGTPYPPASLYSDINAWNLKVVNALRQLAPFVRIHWPALSQGHSDDQDDGTGYVGLELCRSSVEACDVMDVHSYFNVGNPAGAWNSPWYGKRYQRVHALFPDKPIYISEYGGTFPDTPGADAEYKNWLDDLPDYVLGAAAFIWDSDAANAKWIIYNQKPMVAMFKAYTPPAHPGGTPAIVGATIGPATLNVGDLLQVSITVTNNSNTTLPTMGPDPGFVYNEGETFRTDGYTEIANRFRVGIDLNGSTASGGIDHPYRWGLGAPLPPGQSVTVTGAIRLRTAQSRYYWAGLVQEQVAWLQDRVGRVLISANPAKPPPTTTQPVITAIDMTPAVLNAGDLLNVSITVFNGTDSALPTQGPDPGFVYDEGDTFRAKAFGEVRGSIRVGVEFDGDTGVDHPYRWGLGAPLAPGQTAVVSGAIRVKNAQSRNYWVGLVREQVAWLQDKLGTEAITVVGPPPLPSTQPAITAVTFSPTTVGKGNLMQVSVTIQNPTGAPLATQGPNPGFVYNEGDNFLTKHNPPTSGAYRIGLDFDGRAGVDHPYRWGLGAPLAPGATVVVTGLVRLNRRQVTNFWVGLIQESIALLQDRQGVTTITVVRSG